MKSLARMRTLTVIVAGLLSLASPLLSQVQPIDVGHSQVTLLLGKSGLFSAFGDEHTIVAPIVAGQVDARAGAAELTFHSKDLKVVDPKLSPDKRAEVQTRMLSADVLDAQRFPEIQFRSIDVQQSAADQWRVNGILSLHGETHPVSMRVERSNGHYTGSATIKQTWFGIKPVSVAGGTVKVKDEVQVKFDIVLAGSS
jgi:polyisoprenoid-binding protein YceI